MGMNLTRGGLAPAKLTNLVTGAEVRCMFNPFEYTLTKQNSWENNPVIGQNVPEVVFQQGGAQALKLTLHFDSLPQGDDVRQYTDPLWKMMMIDDSKKNTRSGKSAPPEVAFEWGRLYFKAVITNMSQKFVLFKADGTPLRCTVDVSLQQILEEDKYASQQANLPATTIAPPPTLVIEGDRLDHVAARTNNGDASNWRDVAAANNIDNPMKIPNGTNLRRP